ncbi:L,D-transpeptidase [Patescibacteria group bacterium]|nr:MAG: L,D-transpeptidase [Patescibacteria group bacterium]
MSSATEKTKRERAWNESKESVARLVSEFDLQPEAYAIVVNPEKQELYVIQNNAVVEIYPISTSIKGIGTRSGSEKTPWGTHRIKEKIGDEVEVGTVFVAREPTEKVVEPITSPIDTNEDLVTTRIMWLEGEEPNINQGSGVDSHSRYIYIHGTPEEGLIGQPASHGCIRMKNDDVVKLFNTVPTGTLVEIQAREYR